MASQSTAREQDRLDALAQYDILDTPGEESFDRITRLVRRTLQVPMSTLAFLDGHRQWFKARTGIEACEGPRTSAICDVTIRENVPLVINDTLRDPRFADNAHVTGEPYLRFYAGIPLRSSLGHNIGTLCAMDTQPRELDETGLSVLTDLAAIAMNELELRRLASTDGLTGALTRRAFREDASRAMALAQRHRHALSCIALDIDHFKAINDTYGHAAGDSVLAGSAATCRSLLRQSDVFGRVGGEEFAVLLPHTGRQDALGVAEKLREGLAAQRFHSGEAPFSITASFGIASAGPSDDVDALLRAADEALYAAKATGRNRCIVAQHGSITDAALGRRVLKAGLIVFNGGKSVIDCTVRRLSDHGASLAVISTAGVPERFKLAIEVDTFSRTCQVARKAGTEIDVQFA